MTTEPSNPEIPALMRRLEVARKDHVGIGNTIAHKTQQLQTLHTEINKLQGARDYAEVVMAQIEQELKAAQQVKTQ